MKKTKEIEIKNAMVVLHYGYVKKIIFMDEDYEYINGKWRKNNYRTNNKRGRRKSMTKKRRC